MNKVFEHLSEDFEQLGLQAQPAPQAQNPTLLQTSRLSPNEISRLIDQYAVGAVQQMSAYRGISLPGKFKKSQAVHELTKVFYQPASLQKIMARLSPEALDGLNRIKRAGGSLTLNNWLGQMYNRHGQTKTEQAQTELVGGMVALYGQHQYYNQQTMEFRFNFRPELIWDQRFSYDDVTYFWSYSQALDALPALAFPALTDAPRQYLSLTERAEPKIKMPASFDSLLADVIAFLRYIELNKVKLLQSGGVGKRDFVKLNELMTVKEEGNLADLKRLEETGRLNFVWNLLVECQMVERIESPDDYSQYVKVQPDHSEEFYALPRYRQARLLTGAWLRSSFSDFQRISTLEYDEDVQARNADIPDRQASTYARAQVLSVLEKYRRQAKLPVEQWLDFKSLVKIFRDRDPDFLISHNYNNNYYTSAYGDRTPKLPTIHYNGYYSKLKPADKNRAGYRISRYEQLEVPKDWDLVEGEWLTELFAEPLAWLGLAELGLDNQGRPAAFRLTPLGEAVLLKQPTEAEQKLQSQLQELSATDPNSTKALLVQPNFDLMVLAPLQNMALLRQIDRFADQNSLGDVAMYRISKDSFVRGLRSGLIGSEILETLESNSRVPVAQNVVASLNDWVAEFERLLLYEDVNLLELPDATLLDRLMLTPQAGQLIAKRLGPTVALLRGAPDRLTPILQQLQNNKVQPVKVNYNEVVSGCIQAEGDHRLRIIEPAGNPFLYYRLGQFADLVEWNAPRRSATFRLTAQAGQRAQALGLTYEKVIDFLVHFLSPQVIGKTRRPPTLPPVMRVSLRSWLGYYSPASASRAIVVQVTQRVQLDDLMDLPEFQAALLERSGPRTALVRESHFPALRDHLATLGLTIYAPEFDPPTPIQVLPPAASELVTIEPESELPRRGRKSKGESKPKAIPKPKETVAERERRSREEAEAQITRPGNNPLLIGPTPTMQSPTDIVRLFSMLGRGELTLHELGADDLDYFSDYDDDYPPPPPPRLR